MNKYEIWTGNYSLGQGYHQGEVPEKVADIEAISFKVACMKHELKQRLKFIDNLEGDNRNREKDILETGFNFGLNLQTLTQPWLGRYYETKTEADKSFN